MNLNMRSQTEIDEIDMMDERLLGGFDVQNTIGNGGVGDGGPGI